MLTLFYMGMAYDKPSLHSFCCHFDRNKAFRLKTWWQFIFGSSGDLDKVFLIIYYEKTSKTCIFKNLVRNFSFFEQFSWILGLGATIPDFGLGDPGSIPRKTWHFSKSIFKVRLLFLPCGERLLPAIFKMGSTFFVSCQKLEKTHLIENRGKK